MGAKEAEKVMEIMNSYERRGRELGKQEGIEEGKEKGRQEAIMQVAKRMKEKGKQVEEIADLTGLEIETVKGL